MTIQIFNWILLFLVGIVSYFVRDIHAQYKEHKSTTDKKELHFIEELGKVKGKIEMVQQQAINDITRIEQMTQLKLDQISKDVSKLTEIINQLVKQKL
jgi:hypothetical protein